MSETDDLLTVSAIAQLFSLDRRTVARRLGAVKPARIRRCGARTFRFYRLAEVRDLVLAPSDGAAVAAAMETLLAVRADMLAMKRALKVREYISREEFERETASAVSTARTRYLALPTKLADSIAAANKRFPKDEKARLAAIQDEWEAELDQIERELLNQFSWEAAN